MSPRFLSMAEAAREIGISRTRIHQLVKAEKILAFRIGKLWAVPISEVLRYQATRPKRSVPAV